MANVFPLAIVLFSINTLVIVFLMLKVRTILIELKEEDSYLHLFPLTDLSTLNKINKKTNGKYDKLLTSYRTVLVLEIVLALLMIVAAQF
jgi:hypothetical protein